MGKHGPCYHCGVTSTPLWRNGPPEKPVLCNACGSRWRTKGTLANYTPLHARVEPEALEDYRVSKVKTMSIKNKEGKVLKRKYDNYFTGHVGVLPEYNQGSHGKGFDEDTSNRSSSGSAMSNTESCAQYGSADSSDLTGPCQPVWDSTVPSRKRTCVVRSKPSPVEKLTKDLYTIWHEQQSLCFSGSSEEELLLESGKSMVSVEIGHGSVLIQHPSSVSREEESEASSLSIDNKQHTLNSQLLVSSCLTQETYVNLSSRVIDKIESSYQGTEHERIRRDKDHLDKLQILAHHNSPLCHIDLQEILNFDKFMSHLTMSEQQQLLKLLPSIDTLGAPDRSSVSYPSLRSLFNSPQLKEDILSFQKLLADGVFDNSSTGIKTEDSRTLKKFILCNLTKSKWVEHYKFSKDLKVKESIESEVAVESNVLATDSSATVQRSLDGPLQEFSGNLQINEKTAEKAMILKCPRRTSVMPLPSNDQKAQIDKDSSSFFSPKSLFSMHSDNGSSCFADGSSEQDLLLDVPYNGSFPQAELILPTLCSGAEASTSSFSGYGNFGRR